MVKNNLFCFYTFYHKTRKKIFFIPILRRLSYIITLFYYHKEILQILKLMGRYSWFFLPSTFLIALIMHFSISNYFNEAKSIATDFQLAELYADHNAITYNEIVLKTFDRILAPRNISPDHDFTPQEDFMLTLWILHTKLGSDYNAWLLKNPYLNHKLSIVYKLQSIFYGIILFFGSIICRNLSLLPWSVLVTSILDFTDINFQDKSSRFSAFLFVSVSQKLNSYLDLVSSLKYCITWDILSAHVTRWFNKSYLLIVSCYNLMCLILSKTFYRFPSHNITPSQNNLPPSTIKRKKFKAIKVSTSRFDLDEPAPSRKKKWTLLGFDSEESYNSHIFEGKISRLINYFFLAIVSFLIIMGIAFYNIDSRNTSDEYRVLYSASNYPLTTASSSSVRKSKTLQKTDITSIQNFDNKFTLTKNNK